jgi:aryl-alcohol dehydrogenase-like predicted oxidoreductase
LSPLWAGGPEAEPLGVGTWAWGDEGYWGYGRDYSSADVEQAYVAARESGITLFDTAEVYGRGESERLLGRFLREHGDSDRAAVATKFMPRPDRFFRRGPLLDALRASLDRLGLERVALYQIHWPLPLVSDHPWLADLAEAVGRGLIGAVGVSNYGPRRLADAHATLAAAGVPLATNQIRYNLLARGPERSGLVGLCRTLGVRVIAYSPLAQGLLTGRYGRGHLPSGMRGLSARRGLSRLPAVLGVLAELGAGHDRTQAQVALNWLLAKGAIPIPGAKNADQARHNAGALGWSLAEAEVERLDQAGLAAPGHRLGR